MTATEVYTTASTGTAYLHLETRAEQNWRESNEHADCAESCLMLDDLQGFTLHAELADIYARCACAIDTFERLWIPWQ